MSISPSLRQTLHWGGSGLALIGIVFVAFRLHSYWLDLDITKVTPSVWSLIALFALIYGSANILLALAWWHLLRHFMATATRLSAIKIYGISQLAKYVPGNIFHIAGRQALGMSESLSAASLAKSTIWELGLIAVAGALFAWLTLPLLSPAFPWSASGFLLLSFATLIAGLLRRFAGREPAWAFAWQMLFLLISGAIFVSLLGVIAGGEEISTQHWLAIGGAYVVAWLAGLVTPGAPAGVGIREIVLLFLLKGLVIETDLLLAVLLGRLVTVSGDLVFFVGASLIPSTPQTLEKTNESE